MNAIFHWFESRINPYPDTDPTPPQAGLLPFILSCTQGLRPWIFLLMFLTAGIGAFEAYLFQMMGQMVDWLTHLSPAQLWEQKRSAIVLMLIAVAISPVWVFFSSAVKFQTLQGNFPMRLRWNFHRLMLNQSLGFYQDEFAGRVSAKVMQTALAVRDTVHIFADMLVYVLVYFLTMGAILVGFDGWLVLPFIAWMALFVLAMRYFIPLLRSTAERQADARSLMSGRVTDAYSNIATVKLFSHGRRESDYARSAMREFMGTVHAQMRLVTQLETTNHAINMLLIGSTAALGLWLWQQGEIGVGALAAATAMTLRL